MLRPTASLGIHFPPVDSLSKKCESAHFDALPRWRIGRSGRILERSVRRESRPIFFRVIYFEDDRFIAAHLGKINPPMIGIVFEPVGLADPVRIAAFRYHEIVKRNASGIGKRQRI